jgi:cysteine-rich repeat protein
MADQEVEMTKQLAAVMFLCAGAALGCSRNAIRTTGPARLDAGDETMVQPAPDAAGLSDLPRQPDLPADRLPDLAAQVCGNWQPDPGEECDDGNTTDGDGCSSTCQIECFDGFCILRPFCGDARLAWDELCDDGNTTDRDGCSSTCQVEAGFRCSLPGRRCTPICGDGAIKGAETCDDGNTLDGDGCSSICLIEPGWDCGGGACVPLASVDGGQGLQPHFYCGDGIISGAEECDDGPTNSDSNYGGCSSQCRINRCGDGIINGTEECDCGDNYLDDIHIPPCAVRPMAFSISYCRSCQLEPDIGP